MAVNKSFKETKGQVVDIPEGPQVGLFLGLIHLGIQKSEFEGVTSYKDQVLLRFELPDVVSGDGKPATLSKRETNSTTSRSNMLKLVKALRGGKALKDDEGVDFEDLIGLPVQLDIKHSSKGNAVIAGYSAVLEIVRKHVKPLINQPVLLFDVDQISAKELKALPEWLQKTINERVKEEGETDSNVDF